MAPGILWRRLWRGWRRLSWRLLSRRRLARRRLARRWTTTAEAGTVAGWHGGGYHHGGGAHWHGGGHHGERRRTPGAAADNAADKRWLAPEPSIPASGLPFEPARAGLLNGALTVWSPISAAQRIEAQEARIREWRTAACLSSSFSPLLLCAAGVGMYLHDRLGERHRTSETKDHVRLVVSILVTFTALVLSLCSRR